MSYDFNALYAHCMRSSLPCGSAFVYRKENNFKFEITTNLSGKASYEALDWLNFMGRKPWLKNKDGSPNYMITVLDGEKTVSIDGII